jgi:hypothetical protein
MKEIERIITSHEEAIKDGWIDVKESDEDWNYFVKLVEYARSTLTPPIIKDQENDPEFLKRIISRLAYENEKLREKLSPPDTQGALDDDLDIVRKYINSQADFSIEAHDALARINTALTRPNRKAKLLDALITARDRIVHLKFTASDNQKIRNKQKFLPILNQAIAEAEGE